MGDLTLDTKKKELLERQVSFHLGNVSCILLSGEICEEYVFNTYETHLNVDKNDRRTNTMRGDEAILFA